MFEHEFTDADVDTFVEDPQWLGFVDSLEPGSDALKRAQTIMSICPS